MFDAAAVAVDLLCDLEPRLKHSAAVAAQVERVADLVEPHWQSAIKDAAWLHDVGYNAELAPDRLPPA